MQKKYLLDEKSEYQELLQQNRHNLKKLSIQLKEKDNWEWKPLKYIFNYFLSSVDRKIKDEELNVHICHYKHFSNIFIYKRFIYDDKAIHKTLYL